MDVAAATAAVLARIPPDARARSDAYFEGGYWLQLVELGGALLFFAFLLERGWSAGMRARAERWSPSRALQTLYYWIQFYLLGAVAGAPLTLYSDYFREHHYGLSNQTLGAFLGDQGKGLFIELLFGGALVVALLAVVRRLGRSWWLWGAGVTMAFTLFGELIAPVYVAPLFNDYRPLGDEAIRAPILSLARANGIPVDQVYQFDASRQSTRVSANVSGLGHTLRISLNDNLLKRCDRPQILSVMGHEMGHYVLHHASRAAIADTLLVLAAFALLRSALGWALARRGARWGVTGVGDPAVLPLAAGMLALFFFGLTPLANTLSRMDEAEADLFGLNAVREPDAAADVELMLVEYRKVDPSPLEEFLFYDHPSPRNRIFAAMRWKAEQPQK